MKLLFLVLVPLIPLISFSDTYFDIENEFNYYNYSPYFYYKQQHQILDISAGTSAMASINFSNNEKGKFSVGFGLGGAMDYDFSYSTAGAFAFRYGITDKDQVVSKAWLGANGNSSIGVGWSHDF